MAPRSRNDNLNLVSRNRICAHTVGNLTAIDRYQRRHQCLTSTSSRGILTSNSGCSKGIGRPITDYSYRLLTSSSNDDLPECTMYQLTARRFACLLWSVYLVIYLLLVICPWDLIKTTWQFLGPRLPIPWDKIKRRNMERYGERPGDNV